MLPIGLSINVRHLRPYPDYRSDVSRDRTKAGFFLLLSPVYRFSLLRGFPVLMYLDQCLLERQSVVSQDPGRD